jgi:hypothetical protein
MYLEARGSLQVSAKRKEQRSQYIAFEPGGTEYTSPYTGLVRHYHRDLFECSLLKAARKALFVPVLHGEVFHVSRHMFRLPSEDIVL